MRNAMKRWMKVGVTVTAVAALAACAGGGSAAESPAPAAAPTAYSGDPVTIEFWGGNPILSKLADLFNEEQADTGITVTFTEQAGVVQLEQNLRNAFAAGGGPDVFDTITESLNSLASAGIALDVTEYEAPYKDQFSASAFDAVTTADTTYGVPASSIPAFMLYNAQVFADNGLEYPETWDEFVAAGKVLAQKGIKIYNLAGEDYTTYVYLAWQAGAQWWQLEGDGWTVDVDSAETQKAADVLQQLIDNDSVAKISYAEFAAMMQDYNDAKIASRQLSTWQTKSMQANLTTGLGQWEPFRNPSFSGEDEANVSFTRAYAINSNSENPDAAAYFANWAATDEDATKMIASPVDGASWFPAVADPSSYISISEPTQLIGEYVDRWQPVVQNAVDTQKGDWTYGPNAAASFKELADQWGKAVDGQIKVADIAPHMQDWIEKDLEASGITVN